MFKAALEVEKDIATVCCLGNGAEIEPGIIPEVREALDSNVRNIIIDMSGVQHIDAEGVQTFADTVRYAHRRDGKVFLTDMRPQVIRMVSMNQQGLAIPTFNTARDAIREIGFQRLKDYIPPKQKILVVENTTPISRDLARIFREKRLWYSYKLKTVAIGKGFHEVVKDFNPSAILLDATVSTNHGVTLVEWLKSDYVYWYIPLLVVTTDGMVRKAMHFIQNGADDLLFHPFRVDEINPRLQFAIQMYNLVKREKEHQAQEEEENHL